MGNDSKAEPTSDASGSSTAARGGGGGGGGMTIEECQNMIRRSLRHPTVKFLKGHLEKSGCSIESNFIKAVNCEEAIAGGYVPGEGISVCSNHLQLQDQVTQVVIHELIHAYDDCRAANLDWSDCAHHACTEIRAAHLSGDCHYKRELLRGYVRIRGHEQVSFSFFLQFPVFNTLCACFKNETECFLPFETLPMRSRLILVLERRGHIGTPLDQPEAIFYMIVEINKIVTWFFPITI
ncbi:hypothetical protein ACS0TY_001749 [Phlomoides rotata]